MTQCSSCQPEGSGSWIRSVPLAGSSRQYASGQAERVESFLLEYRISIDESDLIESGEQNSKAANLCLSG